MLRSCLYMILLGRHVFAKNTRGSGIFPLGLRCGSGAVSSVSSSGSSFTWTRSTGMRVDLQQDGAYRAAEAHSRNAGEPEARDVIHYVVR